MSDSETTPRTSRIAQLAAALTAASLSCILLGLIGAQWAFLTPMTSFGLFSVGALLGGALTLVLGVIAVFVTRGGQDKVGRRRAWSSTIIAAILLALVAGAAAPGSSAPPINDITTSPGNPPPFLHAVQLPANRGRDMSYPKKFAVITRKSYPDLKALEVNVSVQQVLPYVIDAVRVSGWTVTSINMQAGLIEATDTTPVFRFVDDIVIRMRPIDNQHTILDLRSKSRDGRGDLGANARRIQRFAYEFDRLKKTAP